MDIFEWAFSDKNTSSQLSELKSLRKSIRSEMQVFHKLWKAHSKKRQLVLDLGKNASNLRKLPSVNNEIADLIDMMADSDNLVVSLVRKILYESSDGLHKILSNVSRHVSDNGEIWDPSKITFGDKLKRRTPYNIENAKRAIWAIVKDKG